MKYFSLIYSGDVLSATDEKIIPAKEFDRLLEAKEIITQAKEDVARLQEEHIKQCEVLEEEAKARGYQDGLTKFNEHIIYYEKKMKQLSIELQTNVLPLALKAAKKIVGDELTLNPQAIVQIVMRTLKSVVQNRRIRIYVSKEDRKVVEEHKDDLKKMFDEVDTFVIDERDDIEAGGCIIETETGIINATLENQWRALEAAFERFTKK